MSFRNFILILILSSIGVAFLTVKIFFSCAGDTCEGFFLTPTRQRREPPSF